MFSPRTSAIAWPCSSNPNGRPVMWGRSGWRPVMWGRSGWRKAGLASLLSSLRFTDVITPTIVRSIDPGASDAYGGFGTDLRRIYGLRAGHNQNDSVVPGQRVRQLGAGDARDLRLLLGRTRRVVVVQRQDERKLASGRRRRAEDRPGDRELEVVARCGPLRRDGDLGVQRAPELGSSAGAGIGQGARRTR